MPVKIFFCYAHEDEQLALKLKTHLAPLQREHLIDIFYDRDILAGAEWGKEIDKYIDSAQILLLLVSPDFMNSDYCYGIELARAFERHANGDVRVVPIILRPVSWQGLFGKFKALPKDGKPVKSRHWHNMDEALADVSHNIREIINNLSNAETKRMTREEVDAFRERLSNEPTFPISPLPRSDRESKGEGVLYVKTGSEPGQSYVIKNSLSIGRSPQSDIFLEDLGVSRNHASVYIDSDRYYLLEDIGSTNGTIVNGRVIKKNEPQRLYEGDKIQMGQTLLSFKKNASGL